MHSNLLRVLRVVKCYDGVAGTESRWFASRTRPRLKRVAAGATAAIIHRRMTAGPGTSPSATTPFHIERSRAGAFPLLYSHLHYTGPTGECQCESEELLSIRSSRLNVTSMRIGPHGGSVQWPFRIERHGASRLRSYLPAVQAPLDRKS